MEKNIDCLILAAGRSRRFGQCKLGTTYDGQPLIRYVLKNICTFKKRFRHIYIAARQDSTLLTNVETQVENQLITISVPLALDGIGDTIRYSLQSLRSGAGVMIVLGDQPAIDHHDIERIISAFHRQPSKIISACFLTEKDESMITPPCIFPESDKANLATLKGDIGAKAYIMANQDRLQKVHIPNAGFDVDTPKDFSLLPQKMRKVRTI